MTAKRQNHPGTRQRLTIAWRDCIWFPPVLIANRAGKWRRRHTTFWPVQIITDPTVCVSRAIDPIQL